MHNDKAPSFLQTLIGSFVNFKGYPAFSTRSGGSMFGHYLVLITLCCSLYALITTSWLNSNVTPYLDELANEVPAITIKDGKASVDIEQPHFFEIEGKKIAVIDTTQDPKVYLDEYEAIVVLSETHFISKEQNGKIDSYQLNQDFSIDSDKVHGWIAWTSSWFLPGLFTICFLWQVCWKAVQVLIVAAVVTLIQKSRPDFGTHWKLANLALGPAMVFGLVMWGFTLQGISLPGSGAMFWVILGGLTYYGSDQLRKSPRHS